MRSQWLLAGVALPFLSISRAAADAAVEPITVTAYRTPQALERAGSAVSVVDRELIELRQNTNAADALRAVPGLTVARSGPFGAQTQVRVRGAEANHVLVLIDGVEANDVATDDAFSFEHLETFDIDSIEVVRGPQSALWGSDALAGVISIVTRQPASPLEAGGFAEAGAFGFTNLGVRGGLRGDAGSLAMAVSHLGTDGTNVAASGTEDDGYANTTYSLRGTVQVLPNLSLDASVRHTDARTEFDANDYVDGVLVPVDANNVTHVGQTFLRGGGRLALLGGRLTQSLHYAVSATKTDTTAEEPFADGNPDDGGFDRSSTTGDKYGVYYQGSLRVTDAAGDTPGDLLTLAVDHERETFRQRGEPSFYGDPNQDQSLHATGVALEYLGFFGPGLSFSISGRHDDNSDFDDVDTWRSTLSWRLPATTSRLHASYGTGSKAPTFFERFGFTPDTFIGNPDLKPETSRGWDAGIEQRVLDGRLVADLTYFRADLEDEINGFYCPPPAYQCTAVNETGRSHRKGVESTLAAKLSGTWSLAASYTYTDASQREVAADGRVADVAEIRRPRHAGSVNLTGRWLDRRLSVDTGVYYTGRREDDAFLLDPPYVRRVRLGAYTLVNVTASYAITGAVTLYGRVENLLDEDYQDVYGYNTPGVGAYAGVRVAFAR